MAQSKKDWEKMTVIIHEVPCLPVETFSKRLNVNHVNFFILDLEGAEYVIFKIINWMYSK